MPLGDLEAIRKNLLYEELEYDWVFPLVITVPVFNKNWFTDETDGSEPPSSIADDTSNIETSYNDGGTTGYEGWFALSNQACAEDFAKSKVVGYKCTGRECFSKAWNKRDDPDDSRIYFVPQEIVEEPGPDGSGT